MIDIRLGARLNAVLDTLKSRATIEMQEFDPRNASRGAWIRSGIAAVAALALVGIGHTSGFLGAGSVKVDDPSLLKIAEAPRLTAELRADNAPVMAEADLQAADVAPAERMSIEKVAIQPGDTLGKILASYEVPGAQAMAAIDALSEIFDPRDLRVGQEITLYLSAGLIQKVAAFETDPPDLVGLSLKPTVETTIAVSKTEAGDYEAREIVMELKRELARATGVINNSLYADANDSGATDRVIANFAQIYSFSVDFQREIRQGDTFEILFERFVDEDGNLIKTGEILYASLVLRGDRNELYRFDDGEGIDYYNAKGVSTKRLLMKTPINGARLSSHFGRRHHPVLGYTKMHKGTDFAAPRGTPIFAAGDGTIDRIYRSSSFGKFIAIRHANGWVTHYAHMRNWASGMSKGRRVRQGEVIGYVGTTGRSTGPHLHYEVLKNGVHQNPMGIKVPSGKALEGSALESFQLARAELDELFVAAPDAADLAAAPLVASAEASR